MLIENVIGARPTNSSESQSYSFVACVQANESIFDSQESDSNGAYIKKQIILIIALLILSVNFSFGQYILPESLIAEVENNSLQARWEPSTHDEWFEAKSSGYNVVIEKFEEGLYSMIHSSNVKPLSSAEYAQKISQEKGSLSSFYGNSRDLMYPEESQGFQINDFMKNVIGNTREKTDSFSINLLSYYSIIDMKLAQDNALGYSWDLPTSGKYRVTISVNGYTPRSIIVDSDTDHFPVSSQLKAKFGNRIVELDWEAKDHISKYFGYYIEKSGDGIHFDKMTELPIILNIPSNQEEIRLESHPLTMQDSLVENYKTFYYKLKCIDFFGNVSEPIGSVTGYGFIKMLYSPIISLAEQREDNTAHIEWTVAAIDEPLISHFGLFRADSTDGQYSIVLDSIDKRKRDLNYVMEHNRNHLRLEAIPIDGDSYSSTPVFLMGIDTVAPETPIVIGAVIDTLGNIEVKWTKNEESDLWGYRVFRSNFEDQEYSLLTQVPSLDTIFVDTISLNMGMEKVFYKVLACDFRNNRSPFTDPIILDRPDVRPPLQAVITHLEQKSDSIIVHWSPSVSRDVIEHRMFRRDIENEAKWTLISKIDTNSLSEAYLDIGLNYNTKYAYTIVAVDDTNLESDPADLKMIYTKEPVALFEAFNSYSISYDKEKGIVRLNWDCNAPEEIENYLLYRGRTKTGLSKYEYIDASQKVFEDTVTDYDKAYYKIRPIYATERGNFYSDLLEVTIPTKD